MDRRKKSRKGAYWLIAIVLLIAGGAAFQFLKSGQESAPNKQKVESSKGEEKPPPKKDEEKPAAQELQTTEEKADELIEKMSLRDKIGQMMMVGFQGLEEDDHIKSLIRDEKVGGVILFDRNMQSPGQVAGLTNKLKQEAGENDTSIPLMIGLDQEGGPVLRMRDQVSPIPSQQKLGLRGVPEDVYKIGRLNGDELAAMGIQVDFAPVLDLSNRDERSFGSNTDKAFNLGLQAIKGLNDAKVAATIKHFPGNGRVTVDPHLDESIVKADKQTLETVDMVPFKKMIETQKDNQFFVMVTHVKYPAFDEKMPASISKPIIQNLLRDQLGYKGIVVTDDLDMGAVSKYYSYDQLGYMAISAGADLLLVCHEYNHQVELYNGILKAVKDGKLSEDRINQSVKRILTYKLENVNDQPVSPSNADQVVGSAEHKRTIEEMK
ncbi:beta-N-acetylhexosaminidase [Neobacillus mesonae]|uniref:beta-N-acetylhexosaminidase n=1 Tax=Neobacillus mesonae TaxID=1193713 RepID=UPI002040F9C6|nr:beta-N-acetylhexosaminidase [Neobacillus mesonae]MCM3569000.1 beta-N-acetylhexosaminidase [Neobacillus mesonae]